MHSQSFSAAFPSFKQRGAPLSTQTFYCIDNDGGCSGRATYDGADLGTSLLGKHTLRLMRGEAKIVRCGAETVSAVKMYYGAFKVGFVPGAFSVLEYEKSLKTANGCGGDNET